MGCGCGKRRTVQAEDEDGIRKWLIVCRTFSARVETNLSGIVLCAGLHLARFKGQPFSSLISWIQSLENPQLSVRRMI